MVAPFKHLICYFCIEKFTFLKFCTSEEPKECYLLYNLCQIFFMKAQNSVSYLFEKLKRSGNGSFIYLFIFFLFSLALADEVL